MKKELMIKLAIVLVVCALIYGIFWFFKIGQVEKMVNNFVNESNSSVSVGEVSVSGFPLSQKITITDLKFVIPNPALSKFQIVVKSLEAKSGIFSNDFTVKLDQVTVQDAQSGNSIGSVEFGNEPEIHISFANGAIKAMSYQDNGYRILDAEKATVVYSASSSSLNLASTVEDDDRAVTTISAQVKDMTDFDIINAYKNTFEKGVVERIKTGEISLSATPSDATAVAPDAAIGAPAAANVNSAAVNIPSTPAVVTSPVPVQAAPVAAAAIPQAIANNVNGQQNPDADSKNVPQNQTQDISSAVASRELIKSNLIVEVEYALIPVKVGGQTSDPTQIQDVATQYSKEFTIRTLEFSNPLYKISISGKTNTFEDDILPSGNFTVKIENFSKLVSYISTSIGNIVSQKPAAPVVTGDSADLTNLTKNSDSTTTSEHSYQEFLKRVSLNLVPVTRELSVKNHLSKDDVAVFDVKRERSLNFIVNDTPVREVLGKF